MQPEIVPSPITDRQVDWTGRRIGAWTVVGFAGIATYPGGQHGYYWDCVCDCGRAAKVASSSLQKQTSIGCRGCGSKRAASKISARMRIDRSGQRFNSWTILSYEGPKDYGNMSYCRKQLYKVRCDCGTEDVRVIQSILSGQSRSCRRCRDYPPDMKAKLGSPRKSAVAETRTTTAEG